MPSNYTGNPSSTQAPASAPGDAVDVVMALPVDGDLINGSAFAQAYKVAADWIAFLRNFKATFAHASGSGYNAITFGNFRILIEELAMDSTAPGVPIYTAHTFALPFATTLAVIPIPRSNLWVANIDNFTATAVTVWPAWIGLTAYNAPYPVRIVSIGLVA
jgi:hypothetical protein